MLDDFRSEVDKLSVKSQTANILSFAELTVSVATIELCHCNVKAVIDDT